MSDAMRLVWQLLGNIGGVGFVIIVGFSQFADYLTDKKPRHLLAALAWFVLVPVLILQMAGAFTPPLIETQIIVDGVAIGRTIAILLGMGWGLLRLFEKRREDAVLRATDPEPERKVEE